MMGGGDLYLEATGVLTEVVDLGGGDSRERANAAVVDALAVDSYPRDELDAEDP